MNETSPHTKGLTELQYRLTFLRIGIFVSIGLLILRLWQLQVLDGPYYRDLSQHNRTRSIMLHPARGTIYDRNGKLLANNIPSFNMYVELQDIKNQSILIQKLVQLLSLNATELKKKFSGGGSLTRFKLKGGLSLREAALIESHRLDLPGVVIQPEYQRNNPQGNYAAHVIGYVGEISEDQLDQKKFQGLSQGSIVGQYGIEHMYEEILRGQYGRKLVEVDALGHEKRILSLEKPQAGNDIYLTIDFRLQKLAEELLGKEAGAIVALDPRTGETLALASRPGFDPNALSRGLSSKEWKNILKDPGHPFTNRAIQGQYPPGSVFKIIMASAALEKNVIETTDTMECLGGYQFGNRRFRDWKVGGHGVVNLRKAIAHSCDVYFYKIGNRMGIETIATHSKLFGLGQQTGIDLPSERSGLVPSPLWKEEIRGKPWYPGETILVSIGQGYVTVTPIQMAKVIAIIANNGIANQPKLIRGIRYRKTGVLEEGATPAGKRLDIQPKVLKAIQDSLVEVVEKGTGRRAMSSLVAIAGKTGTSQVVALRKESERETPKEFRDHAWFISYAPIEKPQIAVAVLVEHMGHGGSAAAPLAKKLIEAYMKKKEKRPSSPLHSPYQQSQIEESHG